MQLKRARRYSHPSACEVAGSIVQSVMFEVLLSHPDGRPSHESKARLDGGAGRELAC